MNQGGHMIPSSPHLGGGPLNQPDSDAGSAGINFEGRRKRLNSEGNNFSPQTLTMIKMFKVTIQITVGIRLLDKSGFFMV